MFLFNRYTLLAIPIAAYIWCARRRKNVLRVDDEKMGIFPVGSARGLRMPTTVTASLMQLHYGAYITHLDDWIEVRVRLPRPIGAFFIKETWASFQLPQKVFMQINANLCSYCCRSSTWETSPVAESIRRIVNTSTSDNMDVTVMLYLVQLSMYGLKETSLEVVGVSDQLGTDGEREEPEQESAALLPVETEAPVEVDPQRVKLYLADRIAEPLSKEQMVKTGPQILSYEGYGCYDATEVNERAMTCRQLTQAVPMTRKDASRATSLANALFKTLHRRFSEEIQEKVAQPFDVSMPKSWDAAKVERITGLLSAYASELSESAGQRRKVSWMVKRQELLKLGKAPRAIANIPSEECAVVGQLVRMVSKTVFALPFFRSRSVKYAEGRDEVAARVQALLVNSKYVASNDFSSFDASLIGFWKWFDRAWEEHWAQYLPADYVRGIAHDLRCADENRGAVFKGKYISIVMKRFGRLSGDNATSDYNYACNFFAFLWVLVQHNDVPEDQFESFLDNWFETQDTPRGHVDFMGEGDDSNYYIGEKFNLTTPDIKKYHAQLGLVQTGGVNPRHMGLEFCGAYYAEIEDEGITSVRHIPCIMRTLRSAAFGCPSHLTKVNGKFSFDDKWRAYVASKNLDKAIVGKDLVGLRQIFYLTARAFRDVDTHVVRESGAHYDHAPSWSEAETLMTSDHVCDSQLTRWVARKLCDELDIGTENHKAVALGLVGLDRALRSMDMDEYELFDSARIRSVIMDHVPQLGMHMTGVSNRVIVAGPTDEPSRAINNGRNGERVGRTPGSTRRT